MKKSNKSIILLHFPILSFKKEKPVSQIAFTKVGELVINLDGKIRTFIKLVVEDSFTPHQIINAVTGQYGKVAYIDKSYILKICGSNRSKRYQKNILFIHENGENTVCLISFDSRKIEKKIVVPSEELGQRIISLLLSKPGDDSQPDSLQYFNKYHNAEISNGKQKIAIFIQQK